jgi:hypothetical protein
MAHFAQVVNGVVMDVKVVANAVITDSDGVEQEALGQQFLSGLHGVPAEQFVQCSYSGGFRNTYPGVGFIYDEALDVFVAPKPDNEAWVLNEETFTWEPVEA